MIFIFFVLCLKILLCVELREAGFLTNALRYPCSLYFIQNWFFFHFSWLHWQISYKPGQLGFISLNTGNTALEQIFKRVTISDNFWFTGWKCWRCRSPKPRTWPLLTLRWMCVWVVIQYMTGVMLIIMQQSWESPAFMSGDVNPWLFLTLFSSGFSF